MSRLILYGAGTTGRVIARDLNAKGTPPICFVDSNTEKHGLVMEGVEVVAPSVAQLLYPDATWVASAIHPPQWKEIVAEIAKMGVKTIPVWGFMPQRNTPPPTNVAIELRRLVVHDALSFRMVNDQIAMRNDPEWYLQEEYSDINEIYFPEFIRHRDDEHFVDLGACEGDTIVEFLRRWEEYAYISAFEPDRKNFIKLQSNHAGTKFYGEFMAVSDFNGQMEFTDTGDISAHLGGDGNKVPVITLDGYFPLCEPAPTFIKADIEGSELAALWGARRILKEHKPVLAICAYHEASHFWEIPLLIHALQPEYKLFFRRYAEGSFEIVWYAVPPERVK